MTDIKELITKCRKKRIPRFYEYYRSRPNWFRLLQLPRILNKYRKWKNSKLNSRKE